MNTLHYYVPYISNLGLVRRSSVSPRESLLPARGSSATPNSLSRDSPNPQLKPPPSRETPQALNSYSSRGQSFKESTRESFSGKQDSYSPRTSSRIIKSHSVFRDIPDDQDISLQSKCFEENFLRRFEPKDVFYPSSKDFKEAERDFIKNYPTSTEPHPNPEASHARSLSREPGVYMSSYSVVGSPYAWTSDREVLNSPYADGSIYASLQRPRAVQAQFDSPKFGQGTFQDHSQRPPHLPGAPGGSTPQRKNSNLSQRSVQERPNSFNRKKQSRNVEMTADAGGDCGMGGDVIEVQILPQDDNWGDNTTAITGNTSVRSESFQDIPGTFIRDQDSKPNFTCQRYLGPVLSAFVGLLAFLSPIAMVLMPHIGIVKLNREQLICDSKCDGLLISGSFKLLILLIGAWALFFRQPKATMPRIFVFRTLITLLIFVVTFSYWLFFIVDVLEKTEEVQYGSIVYFSVTLVDVLLFIHYLAVILLELRQNKPQYAMKILRSPDGESKWYNIGQLSVQRAAVLALEKYYQDFPIYNPFLDRIPSKKKSNGVNSSFKYYNVDGETDNGEGRTRALMTASARRRDSAHNERFYEEAEYDRRVKKRKARLVTAAEEAFAHIRRMHEEINRGGNGNPMDPREAAQSIFPSFARALQKYLRITRQQPRHTMESILDHLALCLSYDMSPRAFLEKYLKTEPNFQNDKEIKPIQLWGLVCDQLLSRPITSGTNFQLRQNDVLLLCSVHSLPHFSISEEVMHPKSNKFVLRLNSETSV